MFGFRPGNAGRATCNVWYVDANIPKQLFIRIHIGAGIYAALTGEGVGLVNSIKQLDSVSARTSRR